MSEITNIIFASYESWSRVPKKPKSVLMMIHFKHGLLFPTEVTHVELKSNLKQI